MNDRSAEPQQGSSIADPSAPPPLEANSCALFLDLDGTLAEFASTPDGVGPDSTLTRILRGLDERMGGAVALLTGRTLEDADRILEGALGSVAAVHGLVRRQPDGELAICQPASELDLVRASLKAIAKGQPGLIVEDKNLSIAIHYRQNPAAQEPARTASALLARTTGLVLQEGSMVSELRTAGPDKGDSLKAFLAMAPFLGRTPVAVGDDLTDEHAFAAASELGGYGILVGPARETHALYRLENVEGVLAWLSAEARS